MSDIDFAYLSQQELDVSYCPDIVQNFRGISVLSYIGERCPDLEILEMEKCRYFQVQNYYAVLLFKHDYSKVKHCLKGVWHIYQMLGEENQVMLIMVKYILDIFTRKC